ncbi:MAG: hypothetical protein JWQ23_547 [Herminiimonas sp.]|nr:hypothetical protein [Herminiimonas sp.]
MEQYLLLIKPVNSKGLLQGNPTIWAITFVIRTLFTHKHVANFKHYTDLSTWKIHD